ncbi:hypothetical protein [Nocardiopsis sp. FR4]|uniref:hypothetical protein n=1 Tax=Nocardiopsis sp. FR4 TaxID=2605985 RepID=UPI001915DE07
MSGPVSFFAEVVTFQIVPSGARTTPPWPQKDFVAGFNSVAPASTAESMRLLTVEGWDTMSDSVNPRKPVVGSCEARSPTRVSGPKAAV